LAALNSLHLLLDGVTIGFNKGGLKTPKCTEGQTFNWTQKLA